MKLFLIYILYFLPMSLLAVSKTEKFWEIQSFKDKLAIPKGSGLHMDLAYSSYLIELHSSEVDSAIDYDVLEATIGVSYAHDRWLIGTYAKFLVNELESNMFVVSTQSPLNNHARIEKNEFALYVNYALKENEIDAWKLNVIYRYAVLNALDSYVSFLNYSSHFKYETHGLALSLAYQRKVFEKGVLFGSIGLLYSRANVEMSESINARLQDSFIEDTVNSFSSKVSLGYQYEYRKNLALHVRVDAWGQKFDGLEVSSRVGDSLPSASLLEESYTTYLGLAWRF